MNGVNSVKMLPVSHSHWLVNWFVLFGAPYMAYDIYAMYLSHYHTQRVRGQSRSYSSHSLQTVKAFLSKDWMLVLHHLVLLLIFMPITLVSMSYSKCVYTCDWSVWYEHTYVYKGCLVGAYCAVCLICSSSEEDWVISSSAASSSQSSALLLSLSERFSSR